MELKMSQPANTLATLPGEELAEASNTSVALPDELHLRPVDGLPKWFGRRLASLFMRFVSMEEQRPRGLSSMLTPIAGYFRRDRHVHPSVDADTYRLEVTGTGEGGTFDLAALRALPFEDRVCVQECAGNGNHIMGSAGLCGQARWTGPSLETVLEACGGPGDATHFAFHGLDRIPLLKSGYHYGLSLEELRRARAIVAVEMNGEPLSRRHGFPARLVVPKIYSMSHVKWLSRIEGRTSPHMGIHNRLVFVNKEQRDGRWVRVQARWIGLKSAIQYCRRDRDGWLLTGCAWGGDAPIDRIEVTTDGGATWHEAQVITPDEHFARDAGLTSDDLKGAWALFTYAWRPHPGEYLVASRATNADGEVQRMEEDPNVRGHFNQTRVKWRRVVVPG
ncbi:MAG: molybdopterin-dependent oxidoreductase [Myxococcales bacterium]|nr:molybdopterin-dependent oxidoreductase [Myxococcales bacterium]